MPQRKIVAIITDKQGDRVVVCQEELEHAIVDHFPVIPQRMVLELLELVLKDPTEVFRDSSNKEQVFQFFYRLEKSVRYIVAVVKITSDGAFFASMYPTGKRIRAKHKKLGKAKA